MQIGSALGSVIGQLARVPERRLRLLVACGAAGGISATFNAPIAGVFFALEVILRRLRDRLVRRRGGQLGDGRRDRPRCLRDRRRSSRCPRSALLARRVPAVRRARGVAGAVGRGVHPRALRRRGSRRPTLAWPGVGAPRRSAECCSGTAAAALPEMYGVGYPVLTRAVDGHYVDRVRARPARGEDHRDKPDDRDRRIGRRVRAVAVHGRDARLRLRAGRPRAAAGAARRRPVPTRSSAWGRCSPAPRVRRSPP